MSVEKKNIFLNGTKTSIPYVGSGNGKKNFRNEMTIRRMPNLLRES